MPKTNAVAIPQNARVEPVMAEYGDNEAIARAKNATTHSPLRGKYESVAARATNIELSIIEYTFGIIVIVVRRGEKNDLACLTYKNNEKSPNLMCFTVVFAKFKMPLHPAGSMLLRDVRVVDDERKFGV